MSIGNCHLGLQLVTDFKNRADILFSEQELDILKALMPALDFVFNILIIYIQTKIKGEASNHEKNRAVPKSLMSRKS